MQAQELFNQVKTLIEKKDFQGAQKFVQDNQEELGSYLEQAKGLIENMESSNKIIDSVKGLFGK